MPYNRNFNIIEIIWMSKDYRSPGVICVNLKVEETFSAMKVINM